MFGLAQTLLTFDRRVDFFLRCFLRLLIKPCKSTICLSLAQKKTRAMRPSSKRLRISHNPFCPFIARQSGIPIGQPNSAVRISSPMAFLSSGVKPRSQSRTGTRPASLSKNRAGNSFVAFESLCIIYGSLCPDTILALFRLRTH